MPPISSTIGVRDRSNRPHILSEQVRLLYASSNAGVAITMLAATLLASLQWGIVPDAVVLGWWLYMGLVSIARYVLARRYRLASPDSQKNDNWRLAFTVCIGALGAGWGAAGIILYPENH